ncbi:MAG: hypothetical protein CFH10_00266 [Alphaproteobacteria bacterium MarineAlpha4_Bin2]|nr:MAG: hypothetical protein CFH10_00266 [Alphaproteobacteria bacterium MarineAlpha4_Bin2]
MPETKPDLTFDDEGVCAACRNYENRVQVDWDQRWQEFQEVTERYRRANGENYDCIVPVSGGKDSHYQVIKVLEAGLNPLCVTAMTDDLSDYGRRNIENMKKLGVDYIEVTISPVVRRCMNRIGLEQVGDISWPEHASIFTIPVRISVQHNVPLIVWGENSQDEYGGPASAAKNNVLTRRWLEEFGGLLGLRVTDLIGQEGIEKRHLIQFTYPSDEDLARVGTTGVFLGHYVPWDGFANAEIAKEHGFETYPERCEGSLVNYENLDNHQTRIHDYFKFLKFGYARATDQACLHIRRGRLSRADAIESMRECDGKFPWTYLGKSLEDILSEIGMTLDQFVRICDRFTNKKLFMTNNRGDLIKDEDGNLTKLNYDNIMG